MLQNNVVWGRGLYTLGTVFLNNVLQNIERYNSSAIQFGETGTGKQPNYQLETDKKKIGFRGNNHEEYGSEPFNEEKISIYFSKSDVLEAIDLAKILEKTADFFCNERHFSGCLLHLAQNFSCALKLAGSHLKSLHLN